MIAIAYFWRIKGRDVPFAFLRMALDRRALRKTPGVKFAKMLGCGKGETFTPSDADMTQWGFIVTIDEKMQENFDQSRIVKRWRERATQEFRALLDPIASHGLWSKQNPFDFSETTTSGEVIAITRARISWRKNFLFWNSVPPVTRSLHASPGLIAAIGIGEAPIGLQGTFSHWRSGADLRNFAYKSSEHQEVIAATARHHWYSEELFSRFAVREIRGSIAKKASQ